MQYEENLVGGYPMKLTKLQKAQQNKVLCPTHIAYFAMPAGSFEPCRETTELDLDEPIECEVCTVARMRSAGVL